MKTTRSQRSFHTATLAATVVAVSLTSVVYAEAPAWGLETINGHIPGKLSGHVRFLSMYRDYEATGYGQNSTIGIFLNYTTDRWAGLDAGASYDYSLTLDDGGKTNILANDDVNLLTEGWVRYHFESVSYDQSSLLAGRKIINGSIFRKDDYRQKPRSVEGVVLQIEEREDLKVSLGHAVQMSNWVAVGDRWEFNDFGEVFGKDYKTDGITWGEVEYSGLAGWTISLFDAYAWDVANLVGTKVQYDICDDASLIGYYRHEGSVGRADRRSSDAYGLSYRQRWGEVTLEPGYFGVSGSSLQFETLTTGIDHPLGPSMMLSAQQFAGGAQTAYLKATTTIGKTGIYLFYNHTWHQKLDFNGQELNAVIKQPILENLTACIKVGLGYRDGTSGRDNEFLNDTRLVVTYTF